VEWSEKMMAARYDEQLSGLLYNRQFLCEQFSNFSLFTSHGYVIVPVYFSLITLYWQPAKLFRMYLLKYDECLPHVCQQKQKVKHRLRKILLGYEID